MKQNFILPGARFKRETKTQARVVGRSRDATPKAMPTCDDLGDHQTSTTTGDDQLTSPALSFGRRSRQAETDG